MVDGAGRCVRGHLSYTCSSAFKVDISASSNPFRCTMHKGFLGSNIGIAAEYPALLGRQAPARVVVRIRDAVSFDPLAPSMGWVQTRGHRTSLGPLCIHAFYNLPSPVSSKMSGTADEHYQSQ